MRSSTLFALLAAILLGLGVAVAAKAMGLLSPAEPKKEPPPQMVLVAAGNLFEGACLQANDVRLRPIRPEELEDFRRGDLLPPLTQAAVRRFVKLGIEADRAIRRDHLEDLNAPLSLMERLAPGMEAVNVAVPKSQCAGGMIGVGDWVNVQLTTTIGDASGASTTATALLARNVRVVAKRNSLWPVNTPLGADCPVNFTLELNPYRAAFVSFAKDKGMLTLAPLADADKQQLEVRRHEQMNQPGLVQVAYSQPDSLEYRDEDVRVAGYLQGNYAVGDGDLMRIFQVKIEEPAPPPPEDPATRVYRIVGVQPTGFHTFRNGRLVDPGIDEDGNPLRPGRAIPAGGAPRTTPVVPVPQANGLALNRSSGFTFQPPPCAKPGCSTCKGTPTMAAGVR